MAVTPEILIPRLGDVLVEQGKITVEQLQQALEYQKQLRVQGKPSLIGQVLVELGMIDQESLNGSITQQILILQTSLRAANETLEKKVQERTAELEIAYKKLSEVSQLKANFISNISHELRTPLTHINGYVDLLISDNRAPLNPDQTHSLEVIKRASGRLERLIDDLILFSTSETNKLSIIKEHINPELLLDAVIERNQENAERKNIHLSKHVSIQGKDLFADPGKITWVLNQLVENAIKFTNSGGQVNVSLYERVDDYLFEVSDNGIGIALDKIEEVFEIFFQVDGSSNRSQGGTGLGLALVKNILKAHESMIVVASSPGKGSKFSFGIKKP
ncbi:MAG: ATP-binding protein [Anaerolineaceae bacterium]